MKGLIDSLYSERTDLAKGETGEENQSFHIHYDEIPDTKEYWATEEILYHFEDVPEEERFFITLHLLTANVIWSWIRQKRTFQK